MSKDAKSSDWLVEQLEAERAMFEEDTYPLTTSQVGKFESMHDLLKDKASLKIGSSQRQGRRTRVHNLLADIGSGLGAEVFFLCTQATTITQLATVNQKGLLPALCKWWSRALHPKGLTNVANQLWDSYSVSIFISPVCKRTISEADIAPEQDAPHDTAQRAEHANNQIQSAQVQQRGRNATTAGRHLQTIVDNEGRQPQGSKSPASLQGQENIDKQHTPVDGGVDATTPPNETQSELAAVSRIPTAQRAVTAFEGAILFAAESIPGSKEREAWTSSCLGHLRVLKRLTCINEGGGRHPKRKRGTNQEGEPNISDVRNRVIRARSIETIEAPLSLNSTISQPSIGSTYQGGVTEEANPEATNFRAVPQAQNAGQVEASDMNMALMAEMAKLESILGGYLFEGMKESCIRHREEDRRSMTFTDAVRLHLAYEEGEDFKLEVWLCHRSGKPFIRDRSKT
ncbi:hypothetical protein K469DRAFT_705270 [Zopfia rhizophila CBS 207.26]|uniref:Uncharacterized protein n=1 Tax=Zopfia rhizophila CBS 207.26 TaxID=1314779 RepID=A0A6A6DAI7_9PEZI|nr:hypothetical protein K469DRAFT_705270 [Zopfia rhizophila CBS 207.26]